MTAGRSLPSTGLPVEEAVDDVRAALAGAGTAVLVAPPGAGKTTVVPLRLLDAPWLGEQRIVVLEPRRIAARAAAERMASLLGEPVGETVGYRTRDERRVGRRTRIEVVTEGILVRRLQADPTLEGTGTVLLDEVHERNLVTDLSLALLVDVRSGLRPDLRVLAMSATLAAEPLAALLGADAGPSPIVRSEGRVHPVQVRHLAPGPRDRLDGVVARAVGGLVAELPEGDVLAFVPGVADVRRVVDRLRRPGALPSEVDVRPLSGSHDRADQDLALAPSPPGRRRVVVATDIAESSLTVAGVRAVVDAGLVRVPRRDPSTGTTRLQTEPASLASADQRAGRAGRLGPGIAVRLWDPADQGRRPASVVPEITVVDLAPLALELAVWGAPAADLAFLDPPSPRALAPAVELLEALGAIDATGRPTERGRAMGELPVHPRLAALVLGGIEAGHGGTAVRLAALLEEGDVLRGDPALRPADLGLRLDALAGDAPGGVEVDRRAVRTVARRADELARRVRPRLASEAGSGSGRVEHDAIGRLVAMAHPERIAQGTGGGAFRFRGGGGGRVPSSDPLAAEPWLVAAEVVERAGGASVSLAAPLTRAEVEDLVAADVVETSSVGWDEAVGDLRAVTVRRAGALVLREAEGAVPVGPETVAQLLEHVRRTSGAALGWTSATRALQGRLAFAHRLDPERWPDPSDAALLADLDGWLAPQLARATGVAAIGRVDLRRALLGRVDPGVVHELDALAPTSFGAADDRRIEIGYDDGEPRARARPQRLFGLTVHPTVGGRRRVPVVLELLSPADRPIQVTADLPGFWAGSWMAVRKDLAGRYPKHPWPTDPADAAPPPARRGSRR
jgi:ATP-dependent helicase HrpB